MFNQDGKIAIKFHFYTNEKEEITESMLLTRMKAALSKASIEGTNFEQPDPNCDTNGLCLFTLMQLKDDREEKRWQATI